jgi:hypothetical protein
MSVAEQDDERQARAPRRHRLTPQAADRMLGQMEERAAKAHDETLTCAVTTGRRALAEWQGLAGRLRELEAEYEQVARSESRAFTRLKDALDLLDKFVEPPRMTSASMRPGRTPGNPLAGSADAIGDAVPDSPPSPQRAAGRADRGRLAGGGRGRGSPPAASGGL